MIASSHPRRWRIVVHALDRTGPPVLARAFLRWMRANHPSDELDLIAFRGGALLDDVIRLASVRVVLDPEEPWDWRRPDPDRVRRLRPRVLGLPSADATLLLSVAAGQALPFLDDRGGPVVTWVVEEGEDYPTGVVGQTHRWLAGAAGTAADVRRRLGREVTVHVVPEFVERPEPLPPGLLSRCRAALGAAPHDLLVVAAGIATARKGPDLFLEIAARLRQRNGDARSSPWCAVWLGGERDVLFHRVRAESDRLSLGVRFFGGVADLAPWMAAADVFVHPARLDSFPNVCLHAALAGTPVVAFSGAGGVPEMLGETFIGCPYPDVAGLAEAVAQLREPAARSRAGTEQRAHVEGRYTPEVGAHTLAQHLRTAADATTGRAEATTGRAEATTGQAEATTRRAARRDAVQ